MRRKVAQGPQSHLRDATCIDRTRSHEMMCLAAGEIPATFVVLVAPLIGHRASAPARRLASERCAIAAFSSNRAQGRADRRRGAAYIAECEPS
jgi:hypothetical protein